MMKLFSVEEKGIDEFRKKLYAYKKYQEKNFFDDFNKNKSQLERDLRNAVEDASRGDRYDRIQAAIRIKQYQREIRLLELENSEVAYKNRYTQLMKYCEDLL